MTNRRIEVMEDFNYKSRTVEEPSLVTQCTKFLFSTINKEFLHHYFFLFINKCTTVDDIKSLDPIHRLLLTL